MKTSKNIFKVETMSFLKELAANNNKDWFHSHQIEYETYLKKPLRDILSIMAKRFADLQLPYHASPKLSLFRINRDIRFSKNKDPYKTNIGIFFPYSLEPLAKKSVDKPGLYFHIEPGQCFIAGGIHIPTSDDIKKIRYYIAENWKLLENIIKTDSFSSEFPIILNGDKLKRMPRGFTEDHPKSDWIKLKSFIVQEEVNEKLFLRNDLVDTIERKAISIAPFLDFLYNAVNE